MVVHEMLTCFVTFSTVDRATRCVFAVILKHNAFVSEAQQYSMVGEKVCFPLPHSQDFWLLDLFVFWEGSNEYVMEGGFLPLCIRRVCPSTHSFGSC